VDIFSKMKELGHEQLVFCQDRGAGLKAIIGIHNTTLGPALGGCRMLPYATEDEALIDVFLLSRGMTYKSGASGDSFGGGKVVIIGDPKTDKSEKMFRALGRYVESLGGRFVTGTDVGTVPEDFIISNAETNWVVALPEEYGGSGDSSILTAFGTYRGIQACARHRWGSADLKGRSIAVQGLGKVGYNLIKHLIDAGADVTGADVSENAVERVRSEFDIDVVDPDEIYDVKSDVFSPNALGAVIDSNTIDRISCDIVAGAANNQLADPSFARVLADRGILYAPDYVINAGGLIQVADELYGFNYDRAHKKVAGIYDTLLRIFARAESDGITTAEAADLLVEERLAKIAGIKSVYLPDEDHLD